MKIVEIAKSTTEIAAAMPQLVYGGLALDRTAGAMATAGSAAMIGAGIANIFGAAVIVPKALAIVGISALALGTGKAVYTAYTAMKAIKKSSEEFAKAAPIDVTPTGSIPVAAEVVV
jgi:hypothetical protein